MKPAAFLFLAVGVGMGCGSDKAAKRDPASPTLAARPSSRPASDADARQTMSVDSELGVLDTEDVEAVLQARFDDIRGCYGRAGKAQRYAEGRVLLRFLVNGDGTSEDVLVIESTLGNYDVERCLVEVGRRISFHAPSGRKPTTFEYPVEFRSSNQVPVLDVDGLKMERDLAAFLPQLAACGRQRPRRGRGRLRGADHPDLEALGDHARPRHARDLRDPRHRRDGRGDPPHDRPPPPPLFALASALDCRRRIIGWRRHAGRRRPAELRVVAAVARVDDEADQQPDAEPDPVGPAEAEDHRRAHDDAEDRKQRHEGRPEVAR
jgi:TonB family protein